MNFNLCGKQCSLPKLHYFSNFSSPLYRARVDPIYFIYSKSCHSILISKNRFFIQSWKQTGWRSVIDLLGHFFGCHFYWKNHVFPTQIVCFGLSGGHSNIQSADQETSFIFWQKLQNHSLKKSSRATKTQLAFCSSNSQGDPKSRFCLITCAAAQVVVNWQFEKSFHFLWSFNVQSREENTKLLTIY